MSTVVAVARLGPGGSGRAGQTFRAYALESLPGNEFLYLHLYFEANPICYLYFEANPT